MAENETEKQKAPYVSPMIEWEESLDIQTLSIACNKSGGESDCLNNPPISS